MSELAPTPYCLLGIGSNPIYIYICFFFLVFFFILFEFAKLENIIISFGVFLRDKHFIINVMFNGLSLDGPSCQMP